jgi:hypothetical protein
MNFISFLKRIYFNIFDEKEQFPQVNFIHSSSGLLIMIKIHKFP